MYQSRFGSVLLDLEAVNQACWWYVCDQSTEAIVSNW
jgi:hypothetical protein